jgi:hypothetical protein
MPEGDAQVAKAVRAMVARLGGEKSLWTEVAPEFCGDGHSMGLDLDLLRNRLVEIMGSDPWDEALDVDATMRLLEALYELASTPTEGWGHSYCGNWHPTAYSQRQGRYDFTVEVNRVLKRFESGRRMRGGHIENVVPASMLVLEGSELRNLDARVQELVAKARRDFRSTDFGDRVDAVHSLVQAYERAKSILGAQDKRKGAKLVLDAIVPDPSFPADVDQILASTNRIAHDVFRHEEIDRPQIRADLNLDFWYFYYMNLLRTADQVADPQPSADRSRT